MNPKRLFTLRGYSAFAVFAVRGVRCRVLTGVRIVRRSDSVEVVWRPRVTHGEIRWQDDLQWAFEWAARWLIERGSATSV